MKYLLSLSTSLSVTLWAGDALAADGDLTPLARLASDALVVLAPVVLVLLTAAVGALTRWVARKWGADAARTIDAHLTEIARKAVGYGDEVAHRYLRDHAEKMRGPAKLEAAVSFGLDLAERYRLPEWAAERLPELIAAELGVTRRP